MSQNQIETLQIPTSSVLSHGNVSWVALRGNVALDEKRFILGSEVPVLFAPFHHEDMARSAGPTAHLKNAKAQSIPRTNSTQITSRLVNGPGYPHPETGST